jgi:signal transduction histidine kinase
MPDALSVAVLAHDATLAGVMDVFVRQGMAGMGASGAVLALLDPSDVLVPIAGAGSPLPPVMGLGPLRLDLNVPLTVAARDGVAVWVPSREEAVGRFPDLQFGAVTPQAWAAIPLFSGGQLFGVLGMTFDVPHGFSEAEREFLGSLADLAAMVIGPTVASALSVDAEIAVLDAGGVVIGVNRAWRRFAAGNGGDAEGYVGRSYLEVCDGAHDDSDAAGVATIIRRALDGQFGGAAVITIPCPAPDAARWYDVVVTPRIGPDGSPNGANVMLVPLLRHRSASDALNAADRAAPAATGHDAIGSLPGADADGGAASDGSVAAVAQERERFARDLHDGPMQDIVSTAIMLQGLAAVVPDNLREPVELLVDRQDALLRQLRLTLFDLASSASGARTTMSNIDVILASAARTIGLPPGLTVSGPIESLDAPLVAHLLMVLRETLSNVARHAHATTVHVTIAVTGRALELTVTDDGLGVDDDHRLRGNGILNLEQRARQVGGSCTFTVPVTGGTTVEWTAPRAAGGLANEG